MRRQPKEIDSEDTAKERRDGPRQESLVLDALDGPAPGPELLALVEALLLVAPEAVTIDQLAQGAGVPAEQIEETLREIDAAADRGWVVQRHGGTVQLTTAPRFARYVRRFLRLDREAKLSSAALETLAIIAYEQPVTRAEIEAVRGVDTSGVIATLLARGLIEIAGRLQTAGNPFQYGTTPVFLMLFGLRALEELPPLGDMGGRDAATALKAAVAEADVAQPTAES
ncbi:MAG: SMC-Scp complex subunit ScpB [Thermomicrobiales bacterium]